MLYRQSQYNLYLSNSSQFKANASSTSIDFIIAKSGLPFTSVSSNIFPFLHLVLCLPRQPRSLMMPFATMSTSLLQLAAILLHHPLQLHHSRWSSCLSPAFCLRL